MSKSHLMAWLGLVVGALLLVWPISPKVPLWDLPGVFGGGTQEAANAQIVTPITALASGTPLPDRGDRARLAVGLVLLGVGTGAGLATMERPRRPLPDPPAVESHRSQQP